MLQSLLLMLIACEDGPSLNPVLTALEGDVPQSVEVARGVGQGEVTVPVRLVNTYGAAVAGTSVTLDVEGICADKKTVPVLADTEVTIDESGYGYAQVTMPCSAQFSVTALDSADGATVTDATATSFSLTNTLPLFEMGTGAALPPEAKEPDFVAAGTRGIAIGTGTDVYWQSGDVEQPPHRVLAMPSEIAGMQGAHIDSDGIMDLAVWGGTTAFILRGLDSSGLNRGGYTWQDAWRVDEEQEITGVGVQDLNGDTYPDLAISVTDGLEGWVEILFGDGSWGWETTDVLEVDFPVGSVTADDENKDGWADVTLLDTNSGFVRRYTQFEDGWLEGAPPEFIDPNGFYKAPDGSRLLPMVDLNHDERKDVIINEAPGAGNHQLVFFVLRDTGVTLYQRAYTVYYTTTADMNQDGSADILALEDYILHIIRDDLVLGDFLSQGVTGVGLAAPLTAAFVDGDEIHDVAIVKDHAMIYPGTLVPDDKTKEPVWEAQAFDWRGHNTGLIGPHVVTDTDGNGLADVVGFVENNSGETVIRNWNFYLDSGTPRLSTNGSVGFNTDVEVEPYDIVQCGNDFFALAGTDDGATSRLMRLSVDGGGPSSQGRIDVNGKLLACGDLEAATVVVGSVNGAWTSYDNGLSKVETGDVGSVAGDIAIADPDGDGVREVVACVEGNCTVVAGDIDGDGRDEIVRGSETGITAEGWDTELTLPGVGDVTLQDFDEDGFLDVLAVDDLTGQILVFRGVWGGLSTAVAYHTDEEIHGTGTAWDVTSDGIPEFIIEGAGGTVTHTAETEPLKE